DAALVLVADECVRGGVDHGHRDRAAHAHAPGDGQAHGDAQQLLLRVGQHRDVVPGVHGGPAVDVGEGAEADDGHIDARHDGGDARRPAGGGGADVVVVAAGRDQYALVRARVGLVGVDLCAAVDVGVGVVADHVDGRRDREGNGAGGAAG